MVLLLKAGNNGVLWGQLVRELVVVATAAGLVLRSELAHQANMNRVSIRSCTLLQTFIVFRPITWLFDGHLLARGEQLGREGRNLHLCAAALRTALRVVAYGLLRRRIQVLPFVGDVDWSCFGSR